jgi:hypothetical protein
MGRSRGPDARGSGVPRPRGANARRRSGCRGRGAAAHGAATGRRVGRGRRCPPQGSIPSSVPASAATGQGRRAAATRRDQEWFQVPSSRKRRTGRRGLAPRRNQTHAPRREATGGGEVDRRLHRAGGGEGDEPIVLDPGAPGAASAAGPTRRSCAPGARFRRRRARGAHPRSPGPQYPRPRAPPTRIRRPGCSPAAGLPSECPPCTEPTGRPPRGPTGPPECAPGARARDRARKRVGAAGTDVGCVPPQPVR